MALSSLDKQKIESDFYTLAVSIRGDQSSVYKTPLKLCAWKGGWFWNPKDNLIQYDEEEVETKGVDYWKGIICHEWWHVAITKVEIYEEDIFFKKLIKLTGMHLLVNWIEDPRVNNYIISIYSGAAIWLKNAYDINMKEKLLNEYRKNWFEKVDVSKHFEFIWGTIEYWHTWKFPKVSDPEIEEIWNIVKDKVIYCHTLYPHIMSSDSEKKLLFKKLLAIIYQYIYPKYKYLLDKDIQSAIEKALWDDDNDENQKQQDWQKWQEKWQGNWMEIDVDNLEISFSDEESEEFDWQKSCKLSDLLKWDLSDYQKEILKRKIREALNKASEKAAQTMDWTEWKEISDKIQKEIQKEGITQSLEEEIESEKENTKEIQKELENTASQKILEDVAKEMNKELIESQGDYFKYYSQVWSIIRECYTYLTEVFVEKNRMYENWFSSWSKLNMKKAIQSEISWREQMNVWERKLVRKDRDYAVSFLIDVSGSMVWDKIKNAFLGLIVLSETLHLLWIPFEIFRFNDNVKKIKSFHDIWDKKQQNKSLSLLNMPSWCTADYNAVQEAVTSLINEKRQDNILIVLTDWWSSDAVRLKKSLNKLKDFDWRDWIWVWIWSDTKEVKQNYIDHVIIEDITKLSLSIAKIIKRQLEL